MSSHLIIEGNGEWDPAKATEDPNALLAIVYQTHFTHVGGMTLAMTKIKIQKSFIALDQVPSRSISEFNKEIETLPCSMRGGNISETDRETSAILVWKC